MKSTSKTQQGDFSYDPVYAHRYWRILAQIRPAPAFYSHELGEFLLRYDDLRRASSPEQALLEFFQSTYEAGATLGKWDRQALERRVV